MLGLLRTALRESRHVARGHTPRHADLRLRAGALLVLTAFVDLVASLAIIMFERDEARTGITNFGDAVFWTSTQLLTVSSQLPNPISTPARVLDIFLQMWAISIVAALAGSFGDFFQRRGRESDSAAQEASA